MVDSRSDKPNIQVLPFPSSLPESLKLVSPPYLNPERVFAQLNYVHDYLAKHFKPQSIMIENHYIDRDYMEDHSVFYSRNFAGYENYCRRVHFFQMNADDLHMKIPQIIEIGRDRGRDAYHKECRDFSHEHYLGFTVIKPLP